MYFILSVSVKLMSLFNQYGEMIGILNILSSVRFNFLHCVVKTLTKSTLALLLSLSFYDFQRTKYQRITLTIKLNLEAEQIYKYS